MLIWLVGMHGGSGGHAGRRQTDQNRSLEQAETHQAHHSGDGRSTS